MKILVTGGAGFIASHVVDLLVENKHDVVIVDNLSSGKKQNINPNAKFYQEDITNFIGLKAVFSREKPEIVCHHAAQISVSNSVKDPVHDARINIIGSINLLELCREFKVKKIIYASSGGSIYGNPKQLPCSEKTAPNPLSPYAVSKHAVELYLNRYFMDYGIEYCVLRYSNVFGPRQDPYGEAGVVAIFAKKMLNRETPVINGDGLQTRDYVFVGDVARANLFAVQKKTKSRIFNIGTGKETNVNKIANVISKITGYKGDLIHGPALKGEVRRSSISYTLAKKELGWQPEVGFEQGLRKTVDYIKNNKGIKK